MSRPDTPDVRDEASGVTTVKVKRQCNGCGRRLGDATQEELSALLAERPLPDVREECGCLNAEGADSRFGITAARPIRPEDGPEDPLGPDMRGIIAGGSRRASYAVDDEDYGLFLPHSCDEWVIAAGSDKETVLADARAFRAELDAAIAVLEQA